MIKHQCSKNILRLVDTINNFNKIKVTKIKKKNLTFCIYTHFLILIILFISILTIVVIHFLYLKLIYYLIFNGSLVKSH